MPMDELENLTANPPRDVPDVTIPGSILAHMLTRLEIEQGRNSPAELAELAQVRTFDVFDEAWFALARDAPVQAAYELAWLSAFAASASMAPGGARATPDRCAATSSPRSWSVACRCHTQSRRDPWRPPHERRPPGAP